MAVFRWRISAAIFSLSVLSISAQGPNDAPNIIRPGAPGENNTVLKADAVNLRPKAPNKADVDFMQGMIMHHEQAVEMVGLLAKQGKSKDLQRLGERMRISQSDEIESMRQWLRERGQATEMPMPDMKGMDHSKMTPEQMAAMMPTMPGMLTPKQMEALRKAHGAAFDHLFLTGMIQHHKGALTMVDDLFSTPGAGQDSLLYDFATDVDNTQAAEIKVMEGMLHKEKR
jgi:uncharacterized protein (DUF305 family)